MPLSTPQISELNDEALFALIEKGMSGLLPKPMTDIINYCMYWHIVI